MSIRGVSRAALGATLLGLLWAAPASSTNLATRTFSMSLGVNGSVSDGASSRPAISDRGGLVAFDSVATNLALDGNGPMRDVFARNVIANTTRLISEGPGGAPADGASTTPAIGGDVVAFQSDATNLVEGDTNGTRDVFARDGMGPVRLVSVAMGGAPADGPSTDADVSADGRLVTFLSSATNLVPGDDNGVADVFVRDLRIGLTARISERDGIDADGASAAPSISGDGRFVVFSSRATNLVEVDRNDVQDVFLVDLQTVRMERVSVSSAGKQQNAAVIEPFAQVADVSDGGRLVVFDSDATNLVPGDRNRDTDVFVRDRRKRTTGRVSINRFGFEPNNDSFNPVISPDGRFVAYQSFATNIAPGGARGADIFVFDLKTAGPILMSVGHRGQRRGRETVRQLLQRPAISEDGQLVAFTSTAGNLVSGDGNGAEDVFLRVTASPRVRIVGGFRTTVRGRPRLRLAGDDRRTSDFLCSIDFVRYPCGRSTRLPRMAPGMHTLRVNAGGPGMLFTERPLVRRFRVVR